jgi:hypothetical protein
LTADDGVVEDGGVDGVGGVDDDELMEGAPVRCGFVVDP